MSQLSLNKLFNSGLRWIWLTVLVLIIDQWTKLWANEALAGGQIIEVMPHFDFRLAYNYGAAFSFLADAGGWQTWALSIFAIVISIVLLVWLSRLKHTERWLSIALALVLSGAIGNVYDRLSYGYVIDFIDWYWSESHHWPAFNIADAAISIGAVMLIIESLFFNHDDKNSEQSKKSESKSK